MKPVSIRDLNTAAPVTDSHAGECAAYRLAPSFRDTVTLDGKSNPAISRKVYYPRVKKLPDGSYFLVHMDMRLGGSIYASHSADLRHFTPRVALLAGHDVLRDGEEDRFVYATPDAAVLPNGDLLVVCQWRYAKGYSKDAKNCGLMTLRSHDGGKTFDKEKVVYVGRCWEPYILVLSSGEVQIYFSHTAPKFYEDPSLLADSLIKTSRPDVKDAPYAAHRVSQSYICTTAGGTKCFTDQMATAVELGNGDIAFSCESDCGDYRFRVTAAVSHDNWARPLGIDEAGPADKMFAFTKGAGPYIAHLPSGETLLSFNCEGRQTILYGDEHGKNYRVDEPLTTFGGRWGYWGSLSVDTPHCIIAAYPNIRELRGADNKLLYIDNDLMLARLYLNHRIDACELTPDFVGNTDALFIGAASQAQCAIRAAHDRDRFYLRVDRLDRYLTAGDGIELKLDSVSGSVTLMGGSYENLDFDSTSGDLTVTDAAVGELSADTTSGSLTLGGAFETVDFDTTSGALHLTTSILPQDISCDTVSGGVMLTLPENGGFSATLDSVSGDLTVDGFTGSLHRDTFVYGQGGPAYEFDSVSGDVHIRCA